ncbi:cytosine deaminase [Tanticharoenia sakaeratensis]|uniref:Cytosine deaminase-like protein n=1 Tax=Tanticharoenia sakaeratensis NBRC 103193 TaxID=1231623 RepID=A0A0D6ML19_9PROT|nr:cytosine deaminase [Tanticharoenia sakaeratensis]GAN54354.1 cytosine deaminase-like protein [Tanticharoenia sakaeratensis NBRC 103193]GBQ18855.1 cytosine deaminase [Tanticharoenia sakaeratensis NBRC 103193]
MPLPDFTTSLPTPYTLGDARVPACLLPAEVARDAAVEQGWARVDLGIADGVIASVAPSGRAPAMLPVLDMSGRITLPTFVDLHTHLDKGHIWDRAPNPDGTHAGAAMTVARDRQANWSAQDVSRRFGFGLACAYAHGTSAIRTHLDSYEIEQARISWGVFADMRATWADRIALQAVCMARIDAYGGPDGRELVSLVARHDGLLGGILRLPPGQEAALDAHLDTLFRLAAEHGLDIDLHVDETGDPAADGLDRVARAALRNRFTGQISCGHCCALSVQPDHAMHETMARVRDAGITIITLPMVNLYLQDRIAGRTPRWRGITPVQELSAAGIDVIAASDNCRDPFFMFGDHDMMETFREFVRIGHLDADIADRIAHVSHMPARSMGHTAHIAPGASADLVLCNAASSDQLLARPQSDRKVLRAGRPIVTTPPDYDLLSA